MMFNKKPNAFFSLLFLLILLSGALFAGFAAGTLVKTPKGYRLIESLQVGDWVYSITPQRTIKMSKISHTTSYALPTAIKIVTENDIIIAAPKQKFYLPHQQKWISAKKIQFDHHLGTSKKSCTQEFTIYPQLKITDFFDIRLDDLYAFCVSTDDLIVHNFSLGFIGFTTAWGAGQIALDGIYCGICIAGWWLGTKLLKGTNGNNKVRFTITPSMPNCSPDPDDEEWMRNNPYGRYEESPKHHPNARNGIGKPPRDGQAALNRSVQIKNGPDRVAIEGNHFVVFRQTSPKVYHGYIETIFNELPREARKILHAKNLIRNISKGKIRK